MFLNWTDSCCGKVDENIQGKCQTEQHDFALKRGEDFWQANINGHLNTFHFQTHWKREPPEDRTAVTAACLYELPITELRQGGKKTKQNKPQTKPKLNTQTMKKQYEYFWT